MAHKVLIGGTEYNVVGGRTCIGGTGYDVTKGRPLIGGTGYDIPFSGPLADFVELMSDLTIGTSAGRSQSSTGQITLSQPNENDYVFGFCDGEWSVARKVTATQGVDLYHSDSNKGRLRFFYSVALSNDGGSSNASVYGGTIFTATFPNYSVAEADAILSNLNKIAGAGRNASTTGSVGLSVNANATLMAVYTNGFALSSPLGTVIKSNFSTNPSLLFYSGGTAYLSTNGTSATNVNGGSIIQLG